jgi:septal ring factor EnvC (AmiA/AmiB activator)
MEKEKAKTDKSIGKLEKKRKSTQKKADEYASNIEKNYGEQIKLSDQVSQQEEIIKQIKTRLKEIK